MKLLRDSWLKMFGGGTEKEEKEEKEEKYFYQYP